jgi:hypothetical protein
MKPTAPRSGARRLVPLDELIGAERMQALGPAPSQAALRAALPRGWVPAEDGRHARRDLRLFFREGWILALCLVSFGTLGAMFLLGAMPRGARGLGRLALLVFVLWIAATYAGPRITRALKRSR